MTDLRDAGAAIDPDLYEQRQEPEGQLLLMGNVSYDGPSELAVTKAKSRSARAPRPASAPATSSNRSGTRSLRSTSWRRVTRRVGPTALLCYRIWRPTSARFANMRRTIATSISQRTASSRRRKSSRRSGAAILLAAVRLATFLESARDCRRGLHWPTRIARGPTATTGSSRPKKRRRSISSSFRPARPV